MAFTLAVVAVTHELVAEKREAKVVEIMSPGVQGLPHVSEGPPYVTVVSPVPQ